MQTIEPNETSQLPSITDRPDADIVIFDGHCVFCRSQVGRLNAWDSGGRLAFVSMHDAAVAERFPSLTMEQMSQQMYVVDRQGRAHGGASALRYLSRRLPRLWWAAPWLHIPFSLPIWQWFYRQVAARRYRLSGESCDDDRCQIHLHK